LLYLPTSLGRGLIYFTHRGQDSPVCLLTCKTLVRSIALHGISRASRWFCLLFYFVLFCFGLVGLGLGEGCGILSPRHHRPPPQPPHRTSSWTNSPPRPGRNCRNHHRNMPDSTLALLRNDAHKARRKSSRGTSLRFWLVGWFAGWSVFPEDCLCILMFDDDAGGELMMG